MKWTTTIFIIACSVNLLGCAGCATKKTPEQKKITTQNERNADKEIFKKKHSEFLVLAADARRMDMMQGELAQQRASTQALKDYGALMEKDQKTMLDDIEKLAAQKYIILLDSLSAKRHEGYKELSSKENGEEFDKKFMKMMTIDHERDVKEFKDAKEFSDLDFAAFAIKYLPMVEKHLAGIKQLEEDYEK